NSANFGGGIFNAGGARLTVTSSTLSDNSANSGGGIFNSSSGTLALNNSIVANSPSGGDVYIRGGTVSGSHNLIGDGGNGLGLAGTISGDPLLGPLADNGGPTQTFALLPGSPAIDAGDNNLAVDASNNPLTTDQRGVARIAGGTVDLGAFEVQTISL